MQVKSTYELTDHVIDCLQGEFERLSLQLRTELKEEIRLCLFDDPCIEKAQPPVDSVDSETEETQPSVEGSRFSATKRRTDVVDRDCMRPMASLRHQTMIRRLQGEIPTKVHDQAWTDDELASEEVNASQRDYWRRLNLQGMAIRLVSSQKFEVLTILSVLMNAGLIGYTTDHMARHNLEDEPFLLRKMDLFFCVFFTGDLIVRILAWRRRFFHHGAWNCFDFIIVATQLLTEVIYFFADGRSQGSLMRALRILRCFRVVRILRLMSVLKDLQLLTTCIAYSIGPFLWAAALLSLMIFTMSIYLTQLMAMRMLDSDLLEVERVLISELFGSVPETMLSITQGLTGGIDWRELTTPILDHSLIFGLIFISFLIFVMLAVMNVITGTFVQRALDVAKKIRETRRLAQARECFIALDLNHSGEISLPDINEQLLNPAVEALFHSMDVSTSDAECLFGLIDMDDSGTIDFEEFLSGCLRLQGPAKTTDLLLIARDSRRAIERISQALEALERCFPS